jgi:tripartite-type tricarboxylate transporter receptor subunit TctC
MITRRHLIGVSATAALMPVFSGRAQAEISPHAWPNRFVRLIVPFAPGGANEVTARSLAIKLSELWGQQVVVENKPGASANVGAEAAMRAPPDGYTIFLGSFPNAVNRFLYPNLAYDILADFIPVTLIGVTPTLMCVPNSSPARSVAEFIAYAKANPGKITFASSGAGTAIHLSGQLLKRVAGIEMTHVPYRGGAPALADLIPGRIDLMFNVISSVLPQVRDGQLRGLAVTSTRRVPAALEFPTMAEAGLPGFDLAAWFGLFVPAKTPLGIVEEIHTSAVAALADPGVRDRLEHLGILLVGSTPDEFASYLKSEMDKWGPIIKEAGITAHGADQ